MVNEALKHKVFEVSDKLFMSEEKSLSREQFNAIVGEDLLQYGGIIKDALCSTPKIIKQQGRSGGIRYNKGERYQRAEFSGNERKAILQSVETLLNEYNRQQEKPKKGKPELEVQDGFAEWIKNQDKYFKTPKNRKIGLDVEVLFTEFRSDGRKGGRWENVDGYSMSVESSRYHIYFKPVLTTFEVKPGIPDKKDIRQAEEYLRFSHFAYLIFKTPYDVNKTKENLKNNGYDEDSGLGVFYTFDAKEFHLLYEAKRKNPIEDEIDKKIDVLLSDDDRIYLLRNRIKYTVENILIPAIS